MEVVPSKDPIPVPRDHEGMEAYNDGHGAGGDPGHHYAPDMRYVPATETSTRTQRRLCGMRITTFLLAMALALVVAAVAAVGGGIGSTLKTAQDRARQW